MKKFKSGPLAIVCMAALGLGVGACSQAERVSNAEDVKSETVKAAKEKIGYEYIAMEGFSYELGQFIGLTEGESFTESERKINAVFKAYDGQTDPVDIRMEDTIVEAGWKQVLVTQDGLMDGTVTGQQLLAVFDDEQKLVNYGMRIKCHTDSGSSKWQTEGCG